MKWSNFKLILTGVMFFAYSKAENTENMNTEKKTFWEVIVPEYSKIHYAGSMGMFSVGPGWLYGRKHWETDLLVGFVPTDSRRPTLYTITIKQNYIPWWINISKTITFEPLETGLYLNAILNDKNLWASNPSRYPNGYYWHSNRFKLNTFLGQRLRLKLKSNKQLIKTITAFYEVSTCDLYLIKVFTDNYLKPKDYITFSVGARFGF